MRTLKIFALAFLGHFAPLLAQTAPTTAPEEQTLLKTAEIVPENFLEWHCDTVPVFFVVSGKDRILEEIEGFRIDCYFDAPGEWLEGVQFNPQYRYFEESGGFVTQYMDWHVYLDRPRTPFTKKRN